MKIAYQQTKFNAASMAIVEAADTIIEEYVDKGYNLTLRQLYYQFVARGFLPNTLQSYKRLGDIVGKARLSGLLAWDAIDDRLRKQQHNSHWERPSEILDIVAKQFAVDTRVDQPYLLEVWCFPEETPIVGNGWVLPISTVEVGDEVFTVRGVERVTNTFSREFNGELVQMRATGLPGVDITPNHPVLVKRWDDSKPGYKGARRRFHLPGFCPAGELKARDLLMVPRYKPIEKPTPVDMLGGVRSKKLLGVEIDLSLCRLIGLYLAEGNLRGANRDVQFTLNAKDVQLHAAVVSWLQDHEVPLSTTDGPGTKVVYAYSKALAQWLGEEFGAGAYAKQLPSWTMTLPHDLQSEMLKYYFLGDGSKPAANSRAMVFNTRSRALAWQVHMLLLRLGYSANLRQANDHDIPMWHVGVSGASGASLCEAWGIAWPGGKRVFNHTQLDEEYAYFPIKSVHRREFHGQVHNFEVEGSNSYCVPCVVHNCEKDALLDPIERAARAADVPYLACRGYVSLSAMWQASQRFSEDGRPVVLIHLGDHDPSGIDMTRDIDARLNEVFAEADVTVKRIALNMDQIEQYHPPPNPAKITDSRAAGYIQEFGRESWELDALAPDVIEQLITDEIELWTDPDLLWDRQQLQKIHRLKLRGVADKFREENS